MEIPASQSVEEIVVPYTFFENDRESWSVAVNDQGQHVSTTFFVYDGDVRVGEMVVLRGI